MKAMRGRVVAAEALAEGQRLKVRLTVLADGAGHRTAYLPEREVAALLPRSLLAGPERIVPMQLLATLEPMLSRLAVGRLVRLWSYQERTYASFLPWRGVRFFDSIEEGERSAPRPGVGPTEPSAGLGRVSGQ